MKITFADDAFDAMQTLLEELCTIGLNIQVTYKVPPTRGMVLEEGEAVWCDDEELAIEIENPLSGDNEEKRISLADILEVKVL